MGVGEKVHTRHRRSGATMVLLWNRVGGSAERNGPGGGPGLSIFPVEMVAPSVAGGDLSAFHFKAPYKLRRPARISCIFRTGERKSRHLLGLEIIR